MPMEQTSGTDGDLDRGEAPDHSWLVQLHARMSAKRRTQLPLRRDRFFANK